MNETQLMIKPNIETTKFTNEHPQIIFVIGKGAARMNTKRGVTWDITSTNDQYETINKIKSKIIKFKIE